MFIWAQVATMAEFRWCWCRHFLGPPLMLPHRREAAEMAPLSYVNPDADPDAKPDDPLAAAAEAPMLADLTNRGLICTGYQSGGAGRRAYVTAFTARRETARDVLDECNAWNSVYAHAARAEADGERHITDELWAPDYGHRQFLGCAEAARQLGLIADWLNPTFRHGTFLGRDWWYVAVIDGDRSQNTLLMRLHALAREQDWQA